MYASKQELEQKQKSVAQPNLQQLNNSKVKNDDQQSNPFYEEIVQINQQKQKVLLQSKRFYKKDKWAKDIIQTCINADLQSVTIELHYGPYATKIDFFNFEYKLNFQIDKSFIGSGQYGKICICQFNGRPVAVKMIIFQKENLFQELRRVYREYFIALLASEVRAGPKLIDLFGYQIVFLKNFALFGMQFCEKVTFQNKSIQILQQPLNLLHSFHVVHRDIKPDNIMWSQTYQKIVFIDFGLSAIIKEGYGQKTLTCFAGSYNYCSPQMRKYFILREHGQVDLYKNDLFAIQQTKKKIKEKIKGQNMRQKIQFQHQQGSFINSLARVTRIMNQIYKKNFMEAYQKLVKLEDLIKTAHSITYKKIQKCQIPFEFELIWNTLRKNLRQKIIQNKFLTTQMDEILSQNLQKSDMKIMWSHLLLSKRHIQNFNKWCEDEIYVQRLYQLIDPSKPTSFKNRQIFNQTMLIICTIYGALRQKSTYLLIKQIRFVFLFFFQKFKKFRSKKIQIYKSISIGFQCISDQLNCQRVRIYFLQMIQDPVQYCLLNLLYHFQMFKYFSYTHSQFTYLILIKQKLQKLDQNTKENIFIKIISEIVSKMQQSHICRFTNLKILKQNRSLIKQLGQKIQNIQPQLMNLYLKIKLQSQSFYVFMIQKMQILHIQFTIIQRQCIENKEYQRNNIKKNKKYEKYEKFQYQQKIPFNFRIYEKVKFFSIEAIQDLRDRGQIIKYFFEIAEGQVSLINQQILDLSKLSEPLFFEINYLLEQIKYLKTNDNEYFYGYFVSYSEKLFLFMVGLMQIWKFKPIAKQQSSSQYFYLFDIFLAEFRHKIERIIKDHEQKSLLYLSMKIAGFMKMLYFNTQHQQSEILKKSVQLYDEIMSSNIPDQYQYTIFPYFSTIADIWRYRIFKDRQNNLAIQDMIWKFQTQKRQNIRVPMLDWNILSVVVQIRRKKKISVGQNIDFILDYVMYASKKKFMNSYLPYIKQQDICHLLSYFFQIISPLKIKPFIKPTIQKLQSYCYNFLKDGLLSFFLYLMLTVTGQKQLMNKYKYKFFINFYRFHQYAKTQILIGHFTQLNNSMKYKGRKLMIFLKHLNRYPLNLLIKRASWEKIQKNIMNVKWPTRAHKLIEKKLGRKKQNQQIKQKID